MRRLSALLLLVSAVHAGPETLDAVAARAERRARLRDWLQNDYALVLGQPLTDVLQPRQEGHFFYLTGVDEPGAALLLAGSKAAPLQLDTRGGKVAAHEICLLMHANPRFAQFYGLRFRPGSETARKLGIEVTHPAPRGATALAQFVAGLLPKGARIRIPEYAGPDHATVREIRRGLADSLAKADLVIDGLHAHLSSMRSRKDAYEIDCLRRAITITEAAFREAAVDIRPGSSEAAVDGALLLGVRRRGGRPAYPFVVASGGHAAIPHYFRNDADLEEGVALLIDAGAAWDRYAADVTRVFPVSGRFTPRQREIYGIVLRAQAAAIAAVRPGASFAKVDAAARKVIADAGYGQHFIHGTSHHVGLDVHDPGPTKLEPGMTFTIEPGIYLEKERLGIRIEDIVLVTETGCEVLTRGLPKSIEAIEALMQR